MEDILREVVLLEVLLWEFIHVFLVPFAFRLDPVFLGLHLNRLFK